MKQFNYIPILLMVWGLPVNAEVFKCKQTSGKIIYQPTPCPSGTSKQGVVPVKEMTPEQVEDAKVKLKIWQDEQAANEAVKLQAEKERQEELRKQESLELQRRSVAAQEQQTILDQQRQNQNTGGLYNPYNRRLNRFPYQSHDPHYIPQQHPHHPPFQPKQEMPPMPPSQPIKPGPITMPGTTDKKEFGFK
jgi:hypothetical protein